MDIGRHLFSNKLYRRKITTQRKFPLHLPYERFTSQLLITCQENLVLSIEFQK